MTTRPPASRRPDASSIAAAWLAQGRRVACALLVEVEGSAPLAPGATMLIDDHGSIEGSITGGCVERVVVEEAQGVLAGDRPKLVVYGISDALAGAVGLTCGGTVHVLIHELDATAAAVESAARDVAQKRRAAVATLLDGPHAGAKLALLDDGRVVGSLRGPELLDRNVARDVAGLLAQGITTVRGYGRNGATLGADLHVHVRSLLPPPEMVIFGASDFSAALAQIAKELGYAVTICDARERFVRSPRFERAAQVLVAWPQEALARRTLGHRDAVLVFTHDPKFDEPALRAALATDAGYIGALGSRRTTRERAERLRASGVPAHALARIHAPCGLDIGASTPAEVAISVLAEITAHRTGRSGVPLRATSGAIQPRERPDGRE